MASEQGWIAMPQVREGAQVFLPLVFKAVDNKGRTHPPTGHVMWGCVYVLCREEGHSPPSGLLSFMAPWPHGHSKL